MRAWGLFVESNLSYETHVTTKLLFLPSKYCFESVDITGGGETFVIETIKCLTEALEKEMWERAADELLRLELVPHLGTRPPAQGRADAWADPGRMRRVSTRKVGGAEIFQEGKCNLISCM